MSQRKEPDKSTAAEPANPHTPIPSPETPRVQAGPTQSLLSGPLAGRVLSRRTLNRAYLQRQLLLERSGMPVAAGLEHLVGMQAQAPLAPYVGLWSRLDGFEPETLSGLIAGRAAVRIALMRSTIHLVTAPDCLAIRPVIQPVIDRSLGSNFSKALAGLDLGEVSVAGRALVEDEPATFAELGAALATRWPGRDPLALAMACRAGIPLVQVPPRGLWGRGGLATHTSAEHWLGEPLGKVADAGQLVLRYLQAYGPASVADARTWSGLPGLSEVFEHLRPRLVSYRDDAGRELFDIAQADLPEEDIPAPVRFLPEFDNALLSHSDRTRIVESEHSTAIFTRGAFLVDGRVAGAWRIERSRHSAILALEPFGSLSKAARGLVEAEGEALLEFAAPRASTNQIRYSPT